MPNQYEYRVAARSFRENANAFATLVERAQALLPPTEIDGEFERFFVGSFAEIAHTAHTLASQLDNAANECGARALVCAKYTYDMRRHALNPDMTSEPSAPIWAELG